MLTRGLSIVINDLLTAFITLYLKMPIINGLVLSLIGRAKWPQIVSQVLILFSKLHLNFIAFAIFNN